MTGGFTHEAPKGRTDEWWTPAWFFDGVRFTLDPCGHPRAVVPADTVYALSAGVDGLARPWFGSVFLNPPYSATARWVDRLLEEADAGRITGFATLTFARTGASWAQRLLARRDVRVLFMAKRVRFIPGEGQPASAPGADSMVCAWGDREGFVQHLQERGHGVTR